MSNADIQPHVILAALTGESPTDTEIASYTSCATAESTTASSDTVSTGAVMGRRAYLVQKMLAMKMSNL